MNVLPVCSFRTVNLEVIPQYIDYLLSQKVKSVFVNGTTGEWPSFSVDERKLLAESWSQNGREKLDQIIIHCGSTSLTDAKSLVQHAREIGADAVSCISPSIFKPDKQETLVSFLKEVADSAPDIPFLYYHLPSLTNVQVNFRTFLPLMSKEIKTFVGLKLSTPVLSDVAICLEYMKQRPIALMYGCDEQLHSAVTMGVKSAVGSLYNFLGKEFNLILESSTNDNLSHTEVKDLQMKICIDIIYLIQNHGGGATNKILTSLFSGINMGQPRLPMKQFTDDEIMTIKNYLVEHGYVIKDNYC